MAQLYLLDTNMLSALIRDPLGPVAKRLEEVGESAVCTSLINAAELRFGAAKSPSLVIARRVEQVLASISVLPLEAPVDRHYGVIRFHLEQQGTPIGPNDLLVAAHALALGATVVTANMREFGRVPGLLVENWLAIT